MADKTGREVAEILDCFVNGASRAARWEFVQQLTLCTHRTLQQETFGLFLDCIKGWAACSDNGAFDLRNEATVKLCKKITEKFDTYDMALPYV